MRGRMMAALGAALLGAALAAPAAAQKTPPRTPASKSPKTSSSRYAIVPTLGAMTPAAEAAEERRAIGRADALRATILTAAHWAPLEDDGCEAGALRTFADDTTKATQARADTARMVVDRLEYLVIARGVDTPLTTPSGRALLATLVAWESGASSPRWDAPAGERERHAIAAGLTGRVRNPETNKCQPVAVLDTARFALPIAGVTLPTSPPVPIVVYTTPAALSAARVRVLAAPPVGGGAFSTLNYVRVRMAAVWGDYAVVSVEREGDRVPGAPPAETLGGATYLFHRVNGEWRLLAVPRAWG